MIDNLLLPVPDLKVEAVLVAHVLPELLSGVLDLVGGVTIRMEPERDGYPTDEGTLRRDGAPELTCDMNTSCESSLWPIRPCFRRSDSVE